MITLGGFNLYSFRIVLLAALFRVIVRGELRNLHIQKYEVVMYTCFVWIAVVSGIRSGSATEMINRLSYGFDWGIAYMLARATVFDIKQVHSWSIVFTCLIIPFSLLMLAEKLTCHNYFSVMHGVSPMPLIRDGSVRAAGPFAISILAGTAVAVHLPLVAILYSTNKLLFIAGAIAVFVGVMASASSGPLMALMFTILAMVLWLRRWKVKKYRTVLYFLMVVIEIYRMLFKGGHVWDLLAKIDLTGSSTGWHRAALITSWLVHIKEWWFIGTNYTRHWMPTGVTFSPDHTDITNHYIAQAVNGGLVSISVFIYVLYRAFSNIGACLKRADNSGEQQALWALGAVLFAHTATFISVAYFDKTVLVYYYLIGAISALYVQTVVVSEEKYKLELS